MRLVLANDREYVAGLIWEINPAGGGSEGIAAVLREHKSTFVAVHEEGGETAVGVGRDTGSTVMGEALASVAARAHPERFFGGFEVENGYVVLGCIGRVPHPCCDVFFTDELAASEFLREMDRGQPDAMLFAPASWRVPGAREVGLDELVVGAEGAKVRRMELGKMQQLTDALRDRQRRKKVVLVTVFGVSMLGAAWTAFGDDEKAAEVATTAAVAVTPANDDKTRLAQAKSQWEGAASPASFFEACRAATAVLTVESAGWSGGPVTCRGGEASRNVRREAWATVDRLKERVAGKVQMTGATEGLSSVVMNGIETRGESELMGGGAASQSVDLVASAFEVQAEWQGATIIFEPSPGAKGQSFKSQVFRLIGVWDARLAVGGLQKIPGVSLTAIVGRDDGLWDLEGIMFYAS